MKKLLLTIIGTTFLTTGCAGQKEMQRQVDDLTTQVTTLSKEKEELEAHQKVDKDHIDFLCAMIGEKSTASPMTGRPSIHYLGNYTFIHSESGEIHKMEEMTEKCLDMVGEYEIIVQTRAGALLEEPEEQKSIGRDL